MINISIRVSLQWFKLNRKKSATKITRNELASVCMVAHEIEAIVTARRYRVYVNCFQVRVEQYILCTQLFVLMGHLQPLSIEDILENSLRMAVLNAIV